MNPIKIPAHFNQPILSWKKNVPMAMVKIGVSAFKIPANELSIRVCAMEKKKAGKKEPKKPEITIGFKASFGVSLMALPSKGRKHNPAKMILIEAT